MTEEDVYQEQVGQEGGEIQVQVYTIRDKGGTEFQMDWKDKVSKFIKQGDTVVMEVHAIHAGMSAYLLNLVRDD